MNNDVSFWCLYCELLLYFIPFSSVSIVDYEQVDVCSASTAKLKITGEYCRDKFLCSGDNYSFGGVGIFIAE